MLVSRLVTVYAALLLVLGVLLLFAPVEVGALISDEPLGAEVMMQIVGCALFGFGMTAWFARRTVLGGIYGRAVVAGQQAFAFTSALVLLGGIPESARFGYWVIFGVLASGAALFGWLLMKGPRIDAAKA